jgi:hypothetical protein
MNARLLEVNWVAGKLTPTIGRKRCDADHETGKLNFAGG